MYNKTMNELLKNYKLEIIEDVKIDQVNILDKQMKQPAVRHKWVARLIDAKKQLNVLNKKKKETRRSVLSALEGSMPKGLPKTAIDAKIEASDTIQSINDNIDDTELLIDYLERVEKIFASLTYDYANMTKLLLMETT